MRHLKIIQVVLFILSSIIEVRVKASEVVNLPESTRPIEVPENCILENSLCTVKSVKGTKFELEMDPNAVVLSSESTFGRFSANSGSLIQGQALVKVSSEFRLESPYGAITARSAQYLVDYKQNKVLIRVLSGTVVINAKGTNEEVNLNAGYENWIGRVDTKGQASIGIPQAFNPEATIADYASLHTGSKNEFEATARELQLTWQDAVRESSVVYETVVKRELASQAEKRRLKDIADKKWRKERDELRSMVLKRTFE